MKDKNQIKKAIEHASKDFLGKSGIVGIAEENNNLIFYANLNKLLYDNIPAKFMGYNVYIKKLNIIRPF